jgi:C-terminal processing protease CtpA/Prc
MEDKYQKVNPLPLSSRGRMGFVYSNKSDNFGLVLKVIDNSPASLGKLMVGDHILEINGKSLSSEINDYLYSDTAGRILPIQANVPANMSISRDSSKISLSVKPLMVGWMWAKQQDGQVQLVLGFETE